VLELGMDCGLEGPLPAPPSTPPMTPQAGPMMSPLEEYNRVEPLVAAPLKAGSSYFLVNRR
ncbi:unnamed protein product, partial [Polarella glacialis]